MNQTSYLILATPRSGSYLLSEALEGTGLAGHPAEYFGPHRSTRLHKLWGITSHSDYLDRLLREFATPNGVFGAKVMWRQYLSLLRDLGFGPIFQSKSSAAMMNSRFPDLHYVWITRRDKVRQAVSYWKALQTSRWSLSKGQAQQPVEEPAFDFGAINELMRRILADEEAIRGYLKAHDLQPFTVVYEELVAAYEETAIRILQWLNITVPVDLVFPERRLLRQSDAQSEEWVQHFYQLSKAPSP